MHRHHHNSTGKLTAGTALLIHIDMLDFLNHLLFFFFALSFYPFLEFLNLPWRKRVLPEGVSVECHKTKTKAVTLTNSNTMNQSEYEGIPCTVVANAKHRKMCACKLRFVWFYWIVFSLDESGLGFVNQAWSQVVQN